MRLLRAACADTFEITITNIIRSQTNEIAPFNSLRLFYIAFAPRASRSVQATDDESAAIGSGAHYNSYDELMSATRKGLRTEDGPKDFLVAPLTAVQEIGWNCHEFIEKKTMHGKKSCPETVYASELVKSGLYL